MKEPLPAAPDILDEPDVDELAAAYSAEVNDKLQLLFEHYGINGRGSDAWMHLAIALAKAHVPGLRPREPKTDPEHLVQIFFQVRYLTRIKGLSERQATRVLSEASPELGSPEKIRSFYTNLEFREGTRSLVAFFDRLEREAGNDPVEFGLEGALEYFGNEFRDIKPTARGRPKKK